MRLIILAFSFGLTACSLDAPQDISQRSSASQSSLTLSSSSKSVTVGQSLNIYATGASGQITFSVPGGIGTITSMGSTAVFTAPSSISGSAISTSVLARDGSGKIANITIDILAAAPSPSPSPSPAPAPSPSPNPAPPPPPIEHGIVTFTSSGSWTVPYGITSAKVTIVGGGGGGSGIDFDGSGGRVLGRNGGAGVAFVSGLSAGMVIPIAIGKAGLGYSFTDAEIERARGGTSSFGSFVTATGGDGAYLRDIFPVSPYRIWGDGANAGTFSSSSSNSYPAPGLNVQLNKGIGSAVIVNVDYSEGLPGIVIVEY